MPRRRNNILANNPYVGIDIDFFEKKAMERQGRHDSARANYSKMVQDVANQSYLDPDARQQYLNQQQADFDAVLSKNSGNLSAGYQDVMGAIEKAKTNPYHNLNRRQVDQTKIRQDLVSKYGAEAIDLSNINDPLYTRDSEGNISWADPSQIEANVVQADDYAKVIEGMLSETSAQHFTNQSGIGGGSGNPFYLMSRITKGEILSPEELQRIAMDPNVQQAFLANASTAGIDNRQVPGTNSTYQEMFNNPQSLGQFIYGNIQDKQRNNLHETKKFVSNVGRVKALEHANRKKEIDYEKSFVAEPTRTANFGVVKHTKDSFNKMVDNQKTLERDITHVQQSTNKMATDLFTALGQINIDPSAPKYGMKDLAILSNPNGSFNYGNALKLLGGRDNTSYNPNNLPPNIIEELDNLDNQYREVQDNLETMSNLKKQEKSYEVKEDVLNSKLADGFFKNLSTTDKILLAKYNIASPKDLNMAREGLTVYEDPSLWNAIGLGDATKIGGMTSGLKKLKIRPENLTEKSKRALDKWNKNKHKYSKYKVPFSEISDAQNMRGIFKNFENFKDDALDKGVSTDNVLKVRFNQSAKSQDAKFKKDLIATYNKMDVKTLVDNFTDEYGESLYENYPNLKEYIEENPDAKLVDGFMSNANSGSSGLPTSFILKSPGKEAKPFYVAEARDVGNTTYHLERLRRQISNNAISYDYSPEYDLSEHATDLTNYGSGKHGKEVNSATDYLLTQKRGIREVEINVGTDAMGNPKIAKVNIYKKTTPTGLEVYKVLLEGEDPDKARKIAGYGEQANANANVMAKYLAGGVDLLHDPNTKMNNKLIQEGLKYLKQSN
ncbi:MAG: hypothetical protein GY775_19275 [Candidatus Scalindua sp.]|nr:hypothetical protein [Candidatus Scalindua sp.]